MPTLRVGMTAAKLSHKHKMNQSHFQKAAVVSPNILPYTMGLGILLMFILRSMKCSKQNGKEVLQVLSLTSTFGTIKINEDKINEIMK